MRERSLARTSAHRRAWSGRLPPLPLGSVLICALIASLLLNVGTGAVAISPLQTLAILARHVGIDLSVGVTDQQDAVLWSIRLPRVMLVLLVGAGLGMAGAALQGIFRNPLADPGLIGVSSGAALGAVVAIISGFRLLGVASLPLMAFVGGLTATLVVWRLSSYNGRVEVVTLILSGIAINAIAGAGVGMAIFFADDRQLRSITFWTLGSASGATWRTTLTAGAGIAIGLVTLPRWAGTLNLFALGDREARHLGVNTERARALVIGLAALITGAAVSVAGIVAFVGLGSAHLVRLVSGPDHRIVLPASALLGATLLLTADLVARTAVIPRELPLGVVTAIAGGPFFLWLIVRTRGTRGGWG